MSNKMFSEEYEFFPEETRQILEKAGGLKSFLLGCPRFVVIDNCIALKKVASRLKKKRKKKNIKTKVEEISKSGEYLRVKLPLNPTAREFKPDVKVKSVSDLSSAPTSEEPKPVSANSPKPADETVKPKPVFDNPPGVVPEDVKPKGVPPNSPTPVPEDVKPTTYWTQPQIVTGYCTYLPFRGFDITQTPPTYINVLPSLSQYTNIYTPLAVSSEYQLQRSVPVMPSFVASERPDQRATAYFEGQHLPVENAPGNQITCETQICQNSSEMPVESQCSTESTGTAQSTSGGSDGHCGDAASKLEVNPESANEVTKSPLAKMVAIQVSWNIMHQGVNTEPYDPFEAQQGGISQIEREYQVLQEQLKEACENYEQRKLKGAEETRDLEEKLTRNLEENKISKTELNWFFQDLEKEIKKWQQEKKEIQEKLKSLKKKMKKVLNASEMYPQKSDEQDEEHELLPDQSLEISNTFTNEKLKIEGSIKKGKEHYEESLQRAVAAEVSVLKNWKEMEVFKLQIMDSQAEAYLKTLKLLSSDSAAYPDIESDIRSWESFLTSVREETEKAKSQFEDQIKAVKRGSRLSELPKVQISELLFPACGTARPQFVPESSGHDDQGFSTSASQEPGNQATAPKDSSAGPAGTLSLPPGPPCSPPEVTGLPKTESTDQAPGPETRHGANQKLPAPPAYACASQSPKKPFNSIIEHLSVVFPCYSSTELAGFIKKVQNKTKNSLSGLSIDEMIQRVTEHVLDEGKKPDPSQDRRSSEPSSAASVTKASQDAPSEAVGAAPHPTEPKAEAVPILGTDSCEICHEVFKSKNMRVLKCGHKFHKGCFKQWLKEQSTCPSCPHRDLSEE